MINQTKSQTINSSSISVDNSDILTCLVYRQDEELSSITINIENQALLVSNAESVKTDLNTLFASIINEVATAVASTDSSSSDITTDNSTEATDTDNSESTGTTDTESVESTSTSTDTTDSSNTTTE